MGLFCLGLNVMSFMQSKKRASTLMLLEKTYFNAELCKLCLSKDCTRMVFPLRVFILPLMLLSVKVSI